MKVAQSWPPWREAFEAEDSTPMARAPETRRPAVVKLLWITIWGVYIQAPIGDLASGRHSAPVTALAATGLTAFVLTYLVLVFFRTNQPQTARWVYWALGVLGALALVLSATLGRDWLVLFVYLTVATGAVLQARQSRWGVAAATGLLAGVGYLADRHMEFLPALLIPSLLGGFAMIGVKQMVRTMRELREARETVAHLAATEERLRLARDLHDLLGHSLSLITLKSELAGRMLPDRPQDAAAQVADIERVSRQALVDVREAVSGYRRPTIAVELAGARAALRAAAIHTDLTPAQWTGHPRLAADEESALAWALREAVTNVVRHSGATRCEIALTEDGDTVTLTVTDNGRGPGAGFGLGNGLTGLEERLLLAGGRLTASGVPGGGFRLHAHVPLRGVLPVPG
jgi:two-component system sensor histidine kinase DesK